jgi:hypothetical protein
VAWAFTPLHRNVQFSPDRRFIWFDEQVRSSMGVLQASGVMRPTASSFEIVHYQLSIAVTERRDPAGDRRDQGVRVEVGSLSMSCHARP